VVSKPSLFLGELKRRKVAESIRRFWTSRASAGLWSPLILLLPIFFSCTEGHPGAVGFFKITVVDEETGRGVPLVELKTTNQIRYYTDSNGIIAFSEPGLMDQRVSFHIRSHGYEFDGQTLGKPGTVLDVKEGGSAVLEIKRKNIAERLYRITGEGIFHHSLLTGDPVPTRSPTLNGGVMGQDTDIVIPYRGKLYWFWGDTGGPAHFNGAVSGATSELPGTGGLDPGVGIDLTYFVNESGFSKPMCPIPGPGLVWIDWLATAEDEEGTERLYAKYSRMKNLGEALERGVAVFNDEKEVFERHSQWDVRLGEPHRSTHPFRAEIDGEDYYYFTSGFLYSRVKADHNYLVDPETYESFTPLLAGSTYEEGASRLERESDGRPAYGWKTNTDPVGYTRQQELIAAGEIQQGEGWLHLTDIETLEPIEPRTGSVFWNEYRQRWVMIAEGNIGEVWYAEADTPVGPWVFAVKIVNHDRYTFYNVTHHPFFDQEEGRLIYFDGTYTNSFSGNPDKTPRYNYNQIMYRLSLDDERLFLPAPVYRVNGPEGKPEYLLREGVVAHEEWDHVEEASFFAVPPDRKREGLIPVFPAMEDGVFALRLNPPAMPGKPDGPLFYALPAEPSPDIEKIAGTWRCRFELFDGFEDSLVLELTLEDGKVRGGSVQDNLKIVEGSFRGGRLELQVQDLGDGESYSFTARVQDGELAGELRQDDLGQIGTWEGTYERESAGFAEQQSESPSVAPLYEYRRWDDGTFVYSTNPDLQDSAMQRSAEPVCRVWRNPMSLLILDFETKPLPPMVG
jgi:hypothetical protein